MGDKKLKSYRRLFWEKEFVSAAGGLWLPVTSTPGCSPEMQNRFDGSATAILGTFTKEH